MTYSEHEIAELIMCVLRESRTENGRVELVCIGPRVFLRQYTTLQRDFEDRSQLKFERELYL